MQLSSVLSVSPVLSLPGPLEPSSDVATDSTSAGVSVTEQAVVSSEAGRSGTKGTNGVAVGSSSDEMFPVATEH